MKEIHFFTLLTCFLSGCLNHPHVARVHRQRRLPLRHEGVPDQVLLQEHRDPRPVGVSGGREQEAGRKTNDHMVSKIYTFLNFVIV
jgi:hypothetical protein